VRRLGSLFSSIEAARAGGHGRGFASVAATRAANDNVVALDVLASELHNAVSRFKLPGA